jgi:hypothetical protein
MFGIQLDSSLKEQGAIPATNGHAGKLCHTGQLNFGIFGSFQMNDSA